MGRDDSAAKGETEAETFFTVPHLVLYLIELVEDFFDFFFRYSDPRIGYRKAYAVFHLTQGQRNAPSFGSELVRVGKEIEEYLLYSVDVDRQTFG